VHITQTSAEGYGQIYVGAVNWLLMLVTLGLTVGFGKSDNLASAYGIAVSATMLMTSALLFIAMREIWEWSVIAAGAIAGVFFLVDAGFFTANAAKVAQGGYVPLILAALVYGIMLIWHLGATAVTARLQDEVTPVGAFMAKIAEGSIPRVPGTAVFLTRTQRDVPPVMVWHVKHNRALHENLFVLTVTTESVPWVAETNGSNSKRSHPVSGAQPRSTALWSGRIFRRCSNMHTGSDAPSISRTLPIMSGTRRSCPVMPRKPYREWWRHCLPSCSAIRPI